LTKQEKERNYSFASSSLCPVSLFLFKKTLTC